MSNYSPKEQNFIDGVWDKVRYIEQMRSEEESIRRNKKNYRKKKIMSGLISLTTTTILLSPLLISKSSIVNALPYVGIVLLICGILYEHLIYSKIMEV